MLNIGSGLLNGADGDGGLLGGAGGLLNLDGLVGDFTDCSEDLGLSKDQSDSLLEEITSVLDGVGDTEST